MKYFFNEYDSEVILKREINKNKAVNEWKKRQFGNVVLNDWSCR